MRLNCGMINSGAKLKPTCKNDTVTETTSTASNMGRTISIKTNPAFRISKWTEAIVKSP